MTATTTTTPFQDVADALVGLVPTATPLAAVPSGGAPVGRQAATAVVASLVGDTSADLAVALIDQASLAQASEAATVEVTDVLRPALEAAGATMGTGTLGEVRVTDATDLFGDGEAVIFELTGTAGATAGWFAVRARKPVAQARREPISTGKLSRINNVDMSLSVQVGHTRLPVRDVLELEPGTIVELDRSAGAPADVLLNGRLIALGEVVVVDGGDYGVRITKIVDSED